MEKNEGRMKQSVRYTFQIASYIRKVATVFLSLMIIFVPDNIKQHCIPVHTHYWVFFLITLITLSPWTKLFKKDQCFQMFSQRCLKEADAHKKH